MGSDLKILLASATFICSSISCSQTRQTAVIAQAYEEMQENGSHSISLMSFNVENLFDTVNDPNKNDETFLPLAQKQNSSHRAACAKLRGAGRRQQCLTLDWSEDVLAAKLKRLSEVILSVGDGRGPDLLVLSEVENRRVLEQLQARLVPANYQHLIHLTGPDPRGIDNAILSRLDILDKPKLHKIPYSRTKNSYLNRGILEVDLVLPNLERATVFAVHFPAPYHPIEMRQAAFKHLNKLASKAAQRSNLVVAAGDFNVKAEEDSRLYRQLASSDWWVSHLIACSSCLGTHYFAPRDSWSFLDAIMIWKASGKWRFETESVRVIKDLPGQADTKRGFPISFDPKNRRGVSDHFPVKARIHRQAELKVRK